MTIPRVSLGWYHSRLAASDSDQWDGIGFTDTTDTGDLVFVQCQWDRVKKGLAFIFSFVGDIDMAYMSSFAS